MISKQLARLEAASVSKALSPDFDVNWSVPHQSVAGPILPPEACSLFGTAEFDRLTQAEKSALARHEVSAMLSAFIRFEGVLNQAMARFVRRADPMSPDVPYTLHVIEEEAKHSRMFARLVAALGTGGYSPTGLHGAVERLAEPLIAQSRLIFHYSMYAVESVTDTLLAEILRAGTKYPALEDVCRIHRVEEARHMSFAAENFLDEYRRASRIRKFFARVLAPVIATAIYEVLTPPSVYVRAGVASKTKQAWSLWLASHRSPQRMDLRVRSMARVTMLLKKAGADRAGSRFAWRLLGVELS
ncbi:MAG: diiron oxygenase [Myxococcota bacterium]|nr:diiron oxygenase [Myxococcota bacterium]